MKHATMIAIKHRVQRGFSVITAIFLLVVLAGLGAMAVTFFTAQQQSSSLDILGSRAYQAARAGFEWGAFQITQSQVVSSPGVFATACQSGTSVTPSTQPPTLATPLSSFSPVVSCYATQYTEGTNSFWIYSITATASGITGATAGSTDYVERVMQANIASGVTSTDSGVVYQSEKHN